MSVLAIAALGMAVVLICILLLRLHPLLALILGSLVLLALTPEPIRLENLLASRAAIVVATGSNAGQVAFARPVISQDWLSWPENQLPQSGTELRFTPADEPESTTAAGDLFWYQATSTDGDPARVEAGQRFVGREEAEDAISQRWSSLGSRIGDGLAASFRKLGLPVTMAAIVGVCLLESGAAARVVSALIALMGAKRTAPALSISGFLLGVPVYFDNVFYLMLPLAKAVGRQRPEMYLTAIMAIIVGATMAHSLVPPTPGPLFVAGELGVSVGIMMIAGSIVGGLAACAGYGYGLLCRRWIHLQIDRVPSSDEHSATPENTKPAPPLPLAVAALPLILPIVALGGTEVYKYFRPGHSPAWLTLANDPTLVFMLTALVAITLLRRQVPAARVSQSISRGLADAGVIVLLTCAGGAFGAALKELQIATALSAQFSSVSTPWGLLLTAFFLTAIIRAAQGSATVAMMTSSAIVAPAVAAMDLPFHPVYFALAIGCGSKPLPWMNDSGFWQVATMTGMSVAQTLKTFTVALTLMGLIGFAITLLGAWCLPLV